MPPVRHRVTHTHTHTTLAPLAMAITIAPVNKTKLSLLDHDRRGAQDQVLVCSGTQSGRPGDHHGTTLTAGAVTLGYTTCGRLARAMMQTAGGHDLGGHSWASHAEQSLGNEVEIQDTSCTRVLQFHLAGHSRAVDPRL